MRRAPFAALGCLLLVVSLGALSNGPGTALPPPSSGGIGEIDAGLKKLATNKRLLIIAAHPDDEDTALLTLVSRGMGGEAAYLSLSRGDGGQNLIGDELGPGLGLIRTEELNAARRLDGARQYFTRAYDFGFSKSLEETLRFWPKQALLEDTVRIIRRFRPQVVVTIFSGTPRDGHGQHQASGIVAREAFHLAGDSSAFRELASEGLRPWQPTTLYQTTRFLDREKTTLVLPTGLLDPLTGRSFQQIAVASRSLHRSQGTGALQPIGPSEARVGWVEGGAGRDAKDLFEGTDAELPTLAAGAAEPSVRHELEERLARVAALARETHTRLSPADLSSAVAPIATILHELRAVRGRIGENTPEAKNASATLEEKIHAAESALAAAAGVTLDALCDREKLPRGESATVTVSAWNGGHQSVEAVHVLLTTSEGWSVPAPSDARRRIEPGRLEEWKFETGALGAATPTAPYFLRKPLRGSLYDWSDAPPFVRGEPFQAPPLTATAAVEIAGAQILISREVTHRFRDEVFGEIRHALRVVPRLEVSVEPNLIPWRIARDRRASLEVSLSSHSSAPLTGHVEVALPAGWSAGAAPPSFSLPARGRAHLSLPIESPPGLAEGHSTASVTAVLTGGERFAGSIRMIDYAHIRPVPIPLASVTEISAMHLNLPSLKSVGYVRGAADRVPEALRAVGVPVQVLNDRDLEQGKLSRHDVIVVGSRAYETEPALASANTRLLDYVRGGGLLIVQYQQLGFSEGSFAPEKLEIGRPIDRVTDETAAVKILKRAHPILTTPNRIGESDWEGWVQERGLYFARSWAPAYTPLLSMADPGEPEQQGALLAAKIGKGHYIYTGLAFFRQLPAGVPGAYRLFANLLAWKGKGS